MQRQRRKLDLALAILILSGSLFGQTLSEQTRQGEYDRHLLELQKAMPGWRAAVEQVDVERLTISYQNGKLIEEAKAITLQNFDTARLLAVRIAAHPRLADEISLFGLLGEINSSIAMLDNDLLSFARNGQPADGWESHLETIDDPLSQEQVFQLGAVTAAAQSMESRCSPVFAVGVP
ncbi:MAG TPA: hypothetical protein VHX11_13015 [Acidobacteriaceae bacterium]|nr:hypothetical protein [Acidobacteriaceae bacterium]